MSRVDESPIRRTWGVAFVFIRRRAFEELDFG